ncbi:hypothetical protein QO003_000957 [Arthrobacter silviterrae]|nr:hypothetical protein [Arthrobacter silviterrae]MDQ0276654.1 hypothetical protein [Arthrobacter silviterrae]
MPERSCGDRQRLTRGFELAYPNASLGAEIGTIDFNIGVIR